MITLYIAGPMTGLPDRNYPAFHGAEKVLLKAGFQVENPAHNTGEKWTDYLRASVVQIARCDGVALLPGWSESRGACVEVRLAVSLELRISTVEEWAEAGERAERLGGGS